MKACVVFAALLACISAETAKFVSVKGKLLCNEAEKSKNVPVKIIHETDTPDPNEVLAETTTGDDGEFTLNATRSASGKFEPLIELHHTCLPSLDEKPDHCQPPNWKIYIPHCHVSSKGEQPHVFNIGTWDLNSNKQEGEAGDCVVESLSMTCRSTMTVKCHDHASEGHETHGHAGHDAESSTSTDKKDDHNHHHGHHGHHDNQ